MTQDPDRRRCPDRSIAARVRSGRQPAEVAKSPRRVDRARSEDAPSRAPRPSRRSNVAEAVGWKAGEKPAAARRACRVGAFAEGLDHPRWLYRLPNGDVLVARAIRRAATKEWRDHRLACHEEVDGPGGRRACPAPTASRCCATPTAMAMAESRSVLLTAANGWIRRSAWRWSARRSTSPITMRWSRLRVHARRDQDRRQAAKGRLELPGRRQRSLDARLSIASADGNTLLRLGRLGLEHRRERHRSKRTAPRSGRSIRRAKPRYDLRLRACAIRTAWRFEPRHQAAMDRGQRARHDSDRTCRPTI